MSLSPPWTHRYVRTHMHFSVGGVKAGFVSYLNNKTQTLTPFLQRKKNRRLEESVSKLYFGNYEHNFKMIAFMAPSPLHTSFRLCCNAKLQLSLTLNDEQRSIYINILIGSIFDLRKSCKLPYFKGFLCLFVCVTALHESFEFRKFHTRVQFYFFWLC